MGTNPVIARVAPHFGEEPCISGANGSGTIFFSGCALGCVYCQNYEISSLHRGREITPQELAVVKSFEIYKPKIPIVYNCSGYTSPKILNMLDGIVDIYLPDFKYSNNELALKYSLAPNYVETATVAIKEMLFQVEFDDRQMMQKGIIVRHLILPSHTKNSMEVLDILKKNYGNQILVSLMGQYIPMGNANKYEKINRKITRREYQKVKDYYMMLGFDGFTQELDSADRKYVPDWDF